MRSLPLVLLLLFVSVADAYVLPGDFVIKKAVEATKGRAGLGATYEFRVEGRPSVRALWSISSDRRARLEPGLPLQRLELVGRLLAGDVQGLVTELGVDPYLVALARFDGRIAITLGTRKPDSEAPQLWIDQDRFIPLRFRRGPVDIQLIGTAGMLAGRRALPARIELRHGGHLVWSALLTERPRRKRR